jgi:hypothetical protein
MRLESSALYRSRFYFRSIVGTYGTACIPTCKCRGVLWREIWGVAKSSVTIEVESQAEFENTSIASVASVASIAPLWLRGLNCRSDRSWQKFCNFGFSTFFNPESLGQRPQDIFLKCKSVGSKFIIYSKCPKQPVAQGWVVAKSESGFAKDLQLWLNDSTVPTWTSSEFKHTRRCELH